MRYRVSRLTALVGAGLLLAAGAQSQTTGRETRYLIGWRDVGHPITAKIDWMRVAVSPIPLTSLPDTGAGAISRSPRASLPREARRANIKQMHTGEASQ